MKSYQYKTAGVCCQEIYFELDEENKIRQEGAENAQHTADIITEAEKIKNNANTGNHSNDLHTMADQLHHYANGGK